MEVHIHPSDDGAMAISPNNGAILVNMREPIVSFLLVLRSLQENGKIGVFQVNIITKEAHESQAMTELVTKMQAITYLEHISDLAGENEENIEQKLRKKYFMEI